MDKEILELTPKRRSILWKYTEDDNAMVISIKNEKLERLRCRYENLENLEKQRSVFRSAVPLIEADEEGGYCISLNETATRIWENCDGATSVSEMLEIIMREYDVDKDTLYEDLISFLNFADETELIDKNWRCLL